MEPHTEVRLSTAHRKLPMDSSASKKVFMVRTINPPNFKSNSTVTSDKFVKLLNNKRPAALMDSPHLYNKSKFPTSIVQTIHPPNFKSNSEQKQDPVT